MKLSEGIRTRAAALFRPWRPVPIQPPLTIPRLYAVARRVYDPAIDDAEWSARIKDAVAKEHATPARPHDITAAMTTLTRQLRRPDPVVAPRVVGRQEIKAPLFSRDEARQYFTEIDRRFQATKR